MSKNKPATISNFETKTHAIIMAAAASIASLTLTACSEGSVKKTSESGETSQTIQEEVKSKSDIASMQKNNTEAIAQNKDFSTTENLDGKSNKELALILINNLNLDFKIRGLLTQVAQQTQTYKTLSAQLGNSVVDEQFNQLMDKNFSKFIVQWKNTLADFYVKQFKTEELKSLVSEGVKSPYTTKLVEQDKKINIELKTTFETTITQFIGENLKEIGKLVKK